MSKKVETVKTTTIILFIITAIAYSSLIPLLFIIPFFIFPKYSVPMAIILPLFLVPIGFLAAIFIPLAVFTGKYIIIPYVSWGLGDVFSTLYFVRMPEFVETNHHVQAMLSKDPSLFLLSKLVAVFLAYFSVLISRGRVREVVSILFSVILYAPVAWNLHFISIL